jgi:hypothetical protein
LLFNLVIVWCRALDIQNYIESFFRRYFVAFCAHDLTAVGTCYHLPCVLTTPEQLLLIDEMTKFEQQFSAIFYQVKHANVVDVKATKASYCQLSTLLVLVCIDWQFIDQQQQVFSHFSAFYTLQIIDEQLKIIQVNSQVLENSLTLTHALSIEAING